MKHQYKCCFFLMNVIHECRLLLLDCSYVRSSGIMSSYYMLIRSLNSVEVMTLPSLAVDQTYCHMHRLEYIDPVVSGIKKSIFVCFGNSKQVSTGPGRVKCGSTAGFYYHGVLGPGEEEALTY